MIINIKKFDTTILQLKNNQTNKLYYDNGIDYYFFKKRVF